mmetsp:Transcript_18745/g.41244  ORF Transcript_18745/g.41244 Transcript_18745/m.41244 type:complete len:133 (+) Transcript_18745:386-784(+)
MPRLCRALKRDDLLQRTVPSTFQQNATPGTDTFKLLPVDFAKFTDPGVHSLIPKISVPQVPELPIGKKPEPFCDLLFNVPVHGRRVPEKASVSTPVWMFLLQDLNTAPLKFCRKCVQTKEAAEFAECRPKKM